MPGIRRLPVTIRNAIEAVENPTMMRRMDLRIVIQASGDDLIAIRRIYVMENFIGANSTGGRGLIEAFIVISHDLALAEREIGVMPRVIMPGETFGLGGLSRKRSF